MASTERSRLTVQQARALVAAGFRTLEERRQDVNDLNVYPVPDGDTGTNLSLTVRSVLEELQRAPADLDPAAICGCIANAALMGARGNSGVILSQMIRGAVTAFSDDAPFSESAVVSSFRLATDAAYRAVRKPVDGTMLSVLRDMAAAAEEHVGDGLDGLLETVLRAGWESVRRTPSQLKVLADAGVVDAGGFGLMLVLEGMTSGGEVHAVDPHVVDELAVSRPTKESVEAVSMFTYCTSFLLSGSGLDARGFEEQLQSLGDSLLVVGDTAQLKVHVHTDEPGTVLGLGTALGMLTGIEIDNMRMQTADMAFRAREREAAEASTAEVRTQVVAVVSGPGIKKLFRSLGAGPFVEGGQSMNPSAEELLQAVRLARAPAVIVLPNNKNIIMTAEQIVDLADKEVAVLPTRSIQAGLSAMVAFDRSRAAGENLEEMSRAVAEVVTGEVTRAVRDSTLNGLDIRQGAFIGLVGEEVVVSDDDLDAVVEAVAARLIDAEREIVTVIVGEGESGESARMAAERLRDLYPDVEIEVHVGGQPLYPLLLSAE